MVYTLGSCLPESHVAYRLRRALPHDVPRQPVIGSGGGARKCVPVVEAQPLAATLALPYFPPMAENPTTGELFKAKVILEADVVAAVEAVFAGQATDAYPIKDGYTLDLLAAIEGNPAARAGLVAEGVSVAYRRNLARTAILLARPTKG